MWEDMQEASKRLNGDGGGKKQNRLWRPLYAWLGIEHVSSRPPHVQSSRLPSSTCWRPVDDLSCVTIVLLKLIERLICAELQAHYLQRSVALHLHSSQRTSSTMNGNAEGKPLNEETVPLRTGPPTREELLVHYPPKFTWNQLKTFVNSGDLGLLKRDRKLQKRYDEWVIGIVAEYGSVVKYLMNHRLRWGQPDTLSLLTSELQDDRFVEAPNSDGTNRPTDGEPPAYFSWETPSKYLSIIQNDWPYSVPSNIEHTLIWTKVPIYHPDLAAPSIKARIDQDGLWGFTGLDSPPPSPSTLPACLPALAEWGITLEKMVKSETPTPEKAVLIRRAGSEVHRFVKNRWLESEWETAWFVNPPRLQSVPGLAHIHVFARHK
ncbi:unnamed protein product [Cyclocybe aegerita]|uniref:Uncharacterized protein n=1 Tax=Cyclocybe aegerita TaxID=1973307 RepID=A0A8S0WAA2_CYCAE|nr:unnamed protein product [Cyclocybe aegerita]